MKSIAIFMIGLVALFFSGCSGDDLNTPNPQDNTSITLEGTFTINTIHDPDNDPATNCFEEMLDIPVQFVFKLEGYTEELRGPIKQNKIVFNTMDAKFITGISLALDRELGRIFSDCKTDNRLLLTEDSDEIGVGGSFSSGIISEHIFSFFFNGGEYTGEVDEYGYPVFQNIPTTEGGLFIQRIMWIDECEQVLIESAEAKIEFSVNNVPVKEN